MNYMLIQMANGNFTIVSEHGTNLDSAIMAWHDRCRLLRNDDTTLKYTCAILNERLETVGDYIEYLDRTPIPEPQPEPEVPEE